MNKRLKNSKYLSIVVVTRNDNHTDKFILRMKMFLSTVIKQANIFKLDIEIIIVEWNPPSNYQSIKKVLERIRPSKFCNVRIIRVPKQIHQKYSSADKLGLFQFIAKNVGIRRAKGKFILATNIDIILSNNLVNNFCENKLRVNEMVRVVRFDVPFGLKENWSLEKKMEYCQKHRFREFQPWGTENVKNNTIFYSEILNLYKKVLNLFKNINWTLFHNDVFTNACGDFTLMSKNNWFKLMGYPEFPTHGVKIDGLLCFSSFYNGVKQKILSERDCIYHLDHAYSWSSANSNDYQSGLKKRNVPFISREEYSYLVGIMKKTKKPIFFNSSNWGLGNEKLLETEL